MTLRWLCNKLLLPSMLVEALVMASSMQHLEPFLMQLFSEPEEKSDG